MRSRAMASRADTRDRVIGVKIRARGVRSLSRKISFSIRAHSEKFLDAVVFIEK
jgi:hypothetical protein